MRWIIALSHHRVHVRILSQPSFLGEVGSNCCMFICEVIPGAFLACINKLAIPPWGSSQALQN